MTNIINNNNNNNVKIDVAGSAYLLGIYNFNNNNQFSQSKLNISEQAFDIPKSDIISGYYYYQIILHLLL